MSKFEIIEELGRWSLYQNGVLFNTYSRKDSAVRRMRKLQAQADLDLFDNVDVETTESEKKESVFCESKTSISVFLESLCLFEQANILLSEQVKPQQGVVRPHTPTQRTFVRGAAGAAARSPP